MNYVFFDRGYMWEIMAQGPALFRSLKKMIVEGFQYRNRNRNQALYP